MNRRSANQLVCNPWHKALFHKDITIPYEGMESSENNVIEQAFARTVFVRANDEFVEICRSQQVSSPPETCNLADRGLPIGVHHRRQRGTYLEYSMLLMMMYSKPPQLRTLKVHVGFGELRVLS